MLGKCVVTLSFNIDYSYTGSIVTSLVETSDEAEVNAELKM